MLATIIINTKDQNKFLERAILSCLKQKKFNYEIIVSDLSKYKDYRLRNKYKRNSEIRFINLKEKFLYPTQNQLYAIKTALKYSSGKNIFLLDGDDYFCNKKINYVLNLMKKNNFVMDFPIIFNEYNKKIEEKMKINYKKNKLWYQFLINKWPSISCTSGICIKKDRIKKFFTQTNPFKWKNLAIDIQLAIYAKIEDRIYYTNKNLTYKSKNLNNLDKKYSSFFLKNFWLRRNEQHKFYSSINMKNNFLGFDYYITKVVNFFLK